MAESPEHEVRRESPEPAGMAEGAQRHANGAVRQSAADLRGLLAGRGQWVQRWLMLVIQRARRDFGLRAIALLLAVGLWAFVNAGQRGALVTLRVPVGYRLLPAGMVILNQHPDFVEIEVRGPRTLLSLLDPDRLTLRLDLAGVSVGQAVFKVGPEMFNVPRQTDVTRISPSQIVLDIDRITQRQVPVHLDLHGKPATGYHVTAVKVTPAETTLRGPSRYLAQIGNVQTAAVELAGAKSDIARPVELLAPREGVKLEGPKTVEAQITVSEIIANREFHALPVDVRDTDHKVKVEPQRVSVTVRGPLNQLSNLDLRSSVYVTADGVPPGEHDLPVQVTLPSGIQLVRASPDNVRVRIYRAKRATNG
jgi:YbbR-like protein